MTETDQVQQPNTTHPSSRHIRQLATSVAQYLQPERDTLGLRRYEDELLRVSLDLTNLTITIDVLRDNRPVPVFDFDGQTNSQTPLRYNPGVWTQYLQKLAQQAQEAKAMVDRTSRQQNFAPIDDEDIFSGRT